MVISQTSISVSPHQVLLPPNSFPIRSHCPTSSCKSSSPSIIDSYCSHRNPVPSLQVTEKCFRPLPASRWVARTQDPRPLAPSWTRDPGLAIIAPLPLTTAIGHGWAGDPGQVFFPGIYMWLLEEALSGPGAACGHVHLLPRCGERLSVMEEKEPNRESE